MPQELQTITKSKTKIKTSLLILLSVLVISTASFLAASLFSKQEITNSVSLVTPRNANATNNTQQDPTVGTIALLNGIGDVARFYKIPLGTGRIDVKLTSVDQENDRACFLYQEYDANGQKINEENLCVAPQDIGWSVEVLKLDTATEKVAITVSVPTTK